ncbi:hypothetical protein DRO58_05940 [Candidatus Bathyarchaeota archaeon]|nr:MAG: hypothetical protein DRO58_05940 [Candidatus Bathyarchaeota archaeon]
MSFYRRLKAILWLHLLRLWRYRVSLLNSALSTNLWILLFLLGALMFTPSHTMAETVSVAFWGIVMWSIISNVVSLISGWTRFYLSQGFVEEHMLADTSPFLVLLCRPITGLSMSLLTVAFIYFIIEALSAIPIAAAVEPIILVLGILFLMAMSTSIGLILAALSFRIGVPGMFVEILNFTLLIVGGLMAPIANLPDYLRSIAVFIPFSYPAELIRLGVAGLKPWLPLDVLISISSALCITVSLLAFIVMVWMEDHVRRHGLRAIGRM